MKLQVMTFNLLFAGAINPAGTWNERLPLVVDLLHHPIDIIGLQEATKRQLDDLTHYLPEYAIMPGPESGETRLPRFTQHIVKVLRDLTTTRKRGQPPHIQHAGERRGEHCAILYRKDRFEAVDSGAFWISTEPTVPGSALPGTWLPRVVNWVRLRARNRHFCVTVFNAHLDFLPWAPVPSVRILRAAMDKHWDNTPQILMGDFNALPNSSAYWQLSQTISKGFQPVLQDAWSNAIEKLGPEGTYHGGTGEVRWMGRLDRILFRPTITVRRVTTVTNHVGKVYPSDHFPVLAELEIHGESG